MWEFMQENARKLAQDVAQDVLLGQVDQLSDEELGKAIQEGATPISRYGLEKLQGTIRALMVPLGYILGPYAEEGRHFTVDDLLEFLRRKRPAKYKIIMATPKGKVWAQKVFTEVRQAIYEDGSLVEEVAEKKAKREA